MDNSISFCIKSIESYKSESNVESSKKNSLIRFIPGNNWEDFTPTQLREFKIIDSNNSAENKIVAKILNFNENKEYEVELLNGEISEGEGIYIFSSGDKYQGKFVDGKMQGIGKYIFSNGDKYEGGILNDQRSGKGTYIRANGDKYAGDWRNDMKNGHGIYTTNTTEYEGNWFEQKMDGKIKVTDSKGKVDVRQYDMGIRSLSKEAAIEERRFLKDEAIEITKEDNNSLKEIENLIEMDKYIDEILSQQDQ